MCTVLLLGSDNQVTPSQLGVELVADAGQGEYKANEWVCSACKPRFKALGAATWLPPPPP